MIRRLVRYFGLCLWSDVKIMEMELEQRKKDISQLRTSIERLNLDISQLHRRLAIASVQQQIKPDIDRTI